MEACYTARGTFDIYWEAGIHMWDIAAAAIIVAEAGGVVANFAPVLSADGKDEVLDLKQRKFIVVRPMQGGSKWTRENRSRLQRNI